MEFKSTAIDGLWIIQPKVFEDERGYFFESYNKAIFLKHGIDIEFLQDNQSLSQNNVLRGLHFQNPPFAQGKLVRVINGAVWDIAVDVRKNSKTYGQSFGIELTEKNKTMFWIPPGFAHGFLTLSDNTIFSYKCTNVYNKEAEDSILWNDLDLNINWKNAAPLLSEKDKNAKPFKNFVSLF
ncbi:MAG TPA: dTDP-4-dehydrorhamnose 3,5-epimerase [Bacteroidia bacterium]|nr:dTDP-4-dehydrorhamnose 3,5-epimerase [Bacteroidia bacterium]